MTKLGIIGYGTIATTYIKSLEYLKEYYQLCGIYDIDNQKALNELGNITTIYSSLEDLLHSDIDCVIISTPIHTHFSIASQCLKAHKHVIIEKPATISLSELKELFILAHQHNVVFYVAFHSSFAMDIEWYLSNQENLDSLYRLENISQIECGFYDPYMEDGKIFEDRISLCGSYIDSGVNILSVCDRFTTLETFVTVKHETSCDANAVVYSSNTIYTNHSQKIIMHTGWDKLLNQKRTLLSFNDTYDKILLDHSNQCVKLFSNDSERLLYQETRHERLVNHYINVFKNYLVLNDLSIHEKSVMKTHELLLNN